MKFTSKNIKRISRHKRIRKNIQGTAAAPRLCVFKSNKFIYAQIINDATHATIASASSVKIADKKNAKSIEAAKIVGKQIAEAAQTKNIKKVVFDRSGYIYHGKVKALADAAREHGLEF